MSAPPAFETLRTKLGEIHDLVKVGVAARLGPADDRCRRAAREARAHQLGTIGKLAHEPFVSDEIGALLEELRPYEESLDCDSFEASLIRVARRDYEKAVRVPPELSAEITRVGLAARSASGSRRAQKSDYEQFRPWLEQLVELKHRYVECFPPADELYDTLLDDYEPGMKTAEVRAIFDRLKEVLIPLVEAARAGGDAAGDRARSRRTTQRRLSLEIVRRFGFDDTALAARHGAASVRAVARDARTSASRRASRRTRSTGSSRRCTSAATACTSTASTPALERTLLARGASLGLHESQSRLWENLVGRSRPFWSWFYPRLQETFPYELGSVDEETWFRSINDVSPGLIRIEADEASYNLHIILRFELEQQIMDGLDLRELPDVWNESMDAVPRRRRADDARGVLQDVHWSRGGFGYFPTYSLGNVISVQIWERLREDVDDVDEQIARGEFARDPRVAAREPAPARAEVHAGGDARARRRRADRPRAVPRYLQGKLAAA